MKTIILLSVLLVSGLVCSNVVYADNTVNKAIVEQMANQSISKQVNKLDSMTGGSNIGGRGLKFDFVMNEGDGKATIRWAGEGLGFGKAYDWELKFQAPFDATQADNLDKLNFDGLRNAYELTFGLTYTNYREYDVSTIDVAIGDVCQQYLQVAAIVGNENTCSTSTFSDDELGEEYRDKFWQALANEVKFWRAGINLNTGFESFDFVEAHDLATQISQSKQHFALNAYASYYSYNTTFTLSYVHEEAYKAGLSENLCSEVSEGVNQCVDYIIGAPTKTTKHFLVVEAMHRFDDGEMAINPELTYDVDESKVNLEMPIQLFEMSKENMGGGIKLSWNSITSKPTFGFYTGTKF